MKEFDDEVYLPPDLVNMVVHYQPNCSMTTEDGRRCGLGSSDSGSSEFTYNTSSKTESYCQRECTTSLCSQWLTSLGERFLQRTTK